MLTSVGVSTNDERMLNKQSQRAASKAVTRKAAADGAAVTKRTRLSPHERERQIVQAAVAFFSEAGFDGQMRELARRIGMPNSLLFRYFPTKADLLDRVYREVFEGRWNPDWEAAIADASVPLRERLITFYLDYARVVHSAEWVRTFLYAGLAGLDVNRRYRQLLKRTIYPAVLNQVRLQHGLPAAPADGFSPLEEELVTAMHGMVFHAGIRQWVYGYEVLAARERIALDVDMFLAGAAIVHAKAAVR